MSMLRFANRVPLLDWEQVKMDAHSFNQVKRFEGVRCALALSDSGTSAFVLGHHTSKGAKLPVVNFDLPRLRLQFFVRNNYHNSVVSVNSERPLENDDFSKYKTHPCLSSGFFEGFDRAEAPIYDGYDMSHQTFSFHASNRFPLLARQLLAISSAAEFAALGI